MRLNILSGIFFILIATTFASCVTPAEEEAAVEAPQPFIQQEQPLNIEMPGIAKDTNLPLQDLEKITKQVPLTSKISLDEKQQGAIPKAACPELTVRPVNPQIVTLQQDDAPHSILWATHKLCTGQSEVRIQGMTYQEILARQNQELYGQDSPIDSFHMRPVTDPQNVVRFEVGSSCCEVWGNYDLSQEIERYFPREVSIAPNTCITFTTSLTTNRHIHPLFEEHWRNYNDTGMLTWTYNDSCRTIPSPTPPLRTDNGL